MIHFITRHWGEAGSSKLLLLCLCNGRLPGEGSREDRRWRCKRSLALLSFGRAGRSGDPCGDAGWYCGCG